MPFSLANSSHLVGALGFGGGFARGSGVVCSGSLVTIASSTLSEGCFQISLTSSCVLSRANESRKSSFFCPLKSRDSMRVLSEANRFPMSNSSLSQQRFHTARGHLGECWSTPSSDWLISDTSQQNSRGAVI
ncbi:hypothetical protein EYF80_000782 [Liparis tanakae]|uniref:Uncharacterized protein n=1 Tax=Liparis tanakae TaxID=230148 RepID=A0A4Z2JGM8_9TELE|nr:hypothetical protein EYF80_000782 [Liparis tanakae]